MNTSMLLMTAWIAGADVVPAGCSNCSAPAPVAVAAPVAADCGGCDTCGPAAASHKLGLFTKLKGMFASKGGHHKHAAGCDTCAPAAPACDGCGAAAPATVTSGTPTAIPAVMTPAPVATPSEMPATTPPATLPYKVTPAKEKEKVVAPKGNGFDIPVVVTPVSESHKVPTLGNAGNPF